MYKRQSSIFISSVVVSVFSSIIKALSPHSVSIIIIVIIVTIIIIIIIVTIVTTIIIVIIITVTGADMVYSLTLVPILVLSIYVWSVILSS